MQWQVLQERARGPVKSMHELVFEMSNFAELRAGSFLAGVKSTPCSAVRLSTFIEL